MANDFDWTAADLHVLKSYGDLAVYPNEHGDIVLRQADHMGEDDAVVIVPRQQLNWVIAAMEDALKLSAGADILPGKGSPQS